MNKKGYAQETSVPSSDIVSEYSKTSLSSIGSLNKKDESSQCDFFSSQTKLKILHDRKTKDSVEFSKYFDNNLEKISKNKEMINKIEAELNRIETNNMKMASVIKSHKNSEIQGFKDALKPLQDSLETIESGRNQISQQLSDLNQELTVLSLLKTEKLQILNSKTQAHNAVLKKQKELKTAIEEIKKKSVWDYKDVFSQSEIFKKLEENKQKIKETAKKLKTLETEIETLSATISELEIDNIDTISIKSIEDTLNTNALDLKQLEDYINLQSTRLNVPLLFDFIEESLNNKENPLMNNLINYQVRIIEAKQSEIIEDCKSREENYESTLLQLNNDLKKLTFKYCDLISNQKSDILLEEDLKSLKDKISLTTESYSNLKKSNQIKIKTIQDWISDNRKYFLVENIEKNFSDDEILQDFVAGFKDKVDERELKALESVLNRYYEKTIDRNRLFIDLKKISEQNSAFLASKTQVLNEKNAFRNSKNLERNSLMAQKQQLLESKSKLISEMETSKLKIDSGRKKEFQAYLNQIYELSALPQDCKVPKKSVKTFSAQKLQEIKEEYLKKQQKNIENVRLLKEDYINSKETIKETSNEIEKHLKPELQSLITQISSIKSKISNLEQEKALLELSQTELMSQIYSLQEKKKSDMVSNVQKIFRSHGGGQSYKIDKLYKALIKKESEILDLELNYIKKQKLASAKDIENTLEIVKLKAKQETLDKDYGNSYRTNPTQRNFDKKYKSPHKKHFKQYNSSLGDLNITEMITNSPDIIQENLENDSYTPKSLGKRCISTDIFKNSVTTLENPIKSHINYLEIASEMSYPPEIRYKCAETCSVAERSIITAIIPLLEGSVVYKKFKSKGIFDPIESSITSPDECGYFVRKIKLNSQLTKLEIRNVGKSGVESSILIDQIVSISTPTLTGEILKAQKKPLDPGECTVEAISKHLKDYREMKYKGSIDYSSKAFIAKSKDSSYFPFYLTLKTSKTELISESKKDYKNWIKAVTALIKYKPLLEKLKFKINPY